MSDEAVTQTLSGDVATLTLNRPDMRNALSHDVSEALIAGLEELEGSETRAVVLEGEGTAFCAGGDVNAMLDRMTGDVPLAEAVRIIRQKTSRAVERVAEFPLPTIAKVDGVAFGAGANLALATDIQLASDRASFSFGFRSVGLAVDSGTSYLLPRVVGVNKAKELVFTGKRLDAERAADLGLVNHVYPTDDFEEKTAAFIEEIATGPTVALRNSKRLIDDGLESSLQQAMANEAAAQAAVFETDDHEEGATAFLESRAPDFDGR